jgi:hypothetical protein
MKAASKGAWMVRSERALFPKPVQAWPAKVSQDRLGGDGAGLIAAIYDQAWELVLDPVIAPFPLLQAGLSDASRSTRSGRFAETRVRKVPELQRN